MESGAPQSRPLYTAFNKGLSHRKDPSYFHCLLSSPSVAAIVKHSKLERSLGVHPPFTRAHPKAYGRKKRDYTLLVVEGSTIITSPGTVRWGTLRTPSTKPLQHDNFGPLLVFFSGYTRPSLPGKRHRKEVPWALLRTIN